MPWLNSFVLRLRIIFFAISISMILATTITHIQVRELNRSIKRLADDSISAFVHQNITERSFKSVILILQQVDDATHPGELLTLRGKIDQHLEVLQRQMLPIVGQEESDAGLVQVADAFSSVVHGVQTIFALRHATMESGESLRLSILNLNTNINNTQARLGEVIEDTTLAFNETPQGIDVLNVDELQTLANQLQRENMATRALIAILHEIELTKSAISLLENLALEGEARKVENDVHARLRVLTQLLSQVPRSVDRTELARDIIALRDEIFTSDGTVNNARQMRALITASNLTRNDQLAPIEYFSRVWSERTNAARNEIEIARAELTALTRRMVLLLSFATAAALITIIAALILIVERQINRRVHQLTKAVLAISDGQIDYDVRVIGDDELGKMARALAVFKENAKELRRSNAELEKFAYVAAHDLRSPLRAVQDLADWVLEDEDNKLSEEGLENMNLLRARIGRLNRLLSDLLEYSRAGHHGAEMGLVSIPSEVAALRDLLDPENKFNITLKSERDMIVTHVQPLRQILLNLFANAIKHHDKPEGNIRVETTTINQRLICSVHDDGAGIEPEYHERIFGLFQTLKPRDEVEGSGMGLAIIHKLMESFGGKVWIQSDPAFERGTTFVFELPQDDTMAGPMISAKLM